ncbi:tetratricopeptide repeat protein [Spirochaeta cellobiosiphila]|uniref:tetratricopeptide repeat protein n=1 Tax=Spirochaeta cellobiosiphila TaxID=504483 RepID=UPI0003FC16E8|nr:tetratricopeptide repeat protein [Spirochaeta cellobiosiphila]
MEKLVLSLLVCVLFVSCGPVKTGWDVLIGNYDFNRGKYQEAILKYNDAMDDGDLAPWISYNLGNVYFALGEGETSLDLWNTVDSDNEIQLQFVAHFNKGVYLYETGLYQKAYEEFRAALVLNPSDLGTKRNLELSLDKSQVNKNMGSGSSSGQSQSFEGGDTHPMMDFLKQLEITDWSENEKGDVKWDENVQDW